MTQTRLTLGSSRRPRSFDRMDGRGWLSHGLAALAVSALGLAVAGSVALSGHAEVTGSQRSAATSAAARPSGTSALTVTTGAPLGLPGRPDSSPSGDASTPFGTTTEEESRSQRVREAIVKERAAQRAEELAVAAESVSRAASSEAAQARQEGLTAAERATRERAAALAWEREQRAIAKRFAAQAERTAVETNAPTSTTQIDLSSIPAGSGGTSPVPGAIIGAVFRQTGLWARYHTGVDFRAGHGTPIRAVVAGVVVFAGNTGNWAGNHVAIRHADGYTTMSSHMSGMTVRSGDRVEAGQVIGFVGQTGRAFGAHLHFETYPPGVRHGDVYRANNPVLWLKKYGVTTR